MIVFWHTFGMSFGGANTKLTIFNILQNAKDKKQVVRMEIVVIKSAELCEFKVIVWEFFLMLRFIVTSSLVSLNGRGQTAMAL